jgi:hypothetical protein
MSSKKKTRLKPVTAVRRRLWTTSAGRCQLEGCNTELSLDPFAKTYLNRGYIAHIYGAEENGPRSDHDLNPEQLREFENLMMLCNDCHIKVDRYQEDDFSASRLIAAKAQHLADIKRLTNHASSPRTQLIVFRARIGSYDPEISFRDASVAVLDTHQPNDSSAIEIGITGFSTVEDDHDDYWPLVSKHLEKEFLIKVEALQAIGSCEHFSVFAFAPQPLLVKLGMLIGSLKNVSCYQLSKEPPSWRWQANQPVAHHTFTQTTKGTGPVVLNLSLSGLIPEKRIATTLGPDCSIWTITHDEPHNDYLRSPVELADFRKVIRKAYSQIKLVHGENATINIFPFAPVSTMVETGRTWNPKADLPLVIYDQNKKRDGFIKTITINPKNT